MTVARVITYDRIYKMASTSRFRAVPDITLNESFWILIAAFFHASKPPAKVR